MAEASARPSAPQPEPGRLEGFGCPRMGILFTRIWRLFNHQGEPGPGGVVPGGSPLSPGSWGGIPSAVHPLLRFDRERQRCPAPRRGSKHTTRPASLPDACPQLGLGRTGRRWGSRVKAGGAGLGPGGASEPSGCRMRKTGTRARLVRFASGGSLWGEGRGDPRRGTVLGGSPLPRLCLW